MKPLPKPEEIRRVFDVPGAFRPGSHRLVENGIEVFGRLTFDGTTVPVGIQAGQAAHGVAWPFCSESVALCWWPLRPAATLPEGAGAAVEAVLRFLLVRLEPLQWFQELLAHRRQPSRTWCFELPGGLRSIEPDLLAATCGESHIDLYVQLHSNCVQDCLFCPTCSPDFDAADQDADVDFVGRLASQVVVPAAANGVTSSFRFDADDIVAHRRLPDLMKIVSDSCGCPMHLVIPANRLSVPATAAAVAGLPGLMKLSTTIFGATPGTHDRIAGRRGAFVETVRALRNLSTQPLWVQGHFVLTAGACLEIGAVADTLAHFKLDLMIQSLIADCSAHETVLRPIMPDMAIVKESLAAFSDRLLAASSAVNVAITDFPVCVVPPHLRHLAQTDHPRQSLHRYTLVSCCLGCVHSERCIGVSPMYVELYGESGLERE